MKMNRIGTAEAVQIREYLESEGLTQKWLSLHLERDHGVKLSTSRIAILLSGRDSDYKGARLFGRKGQIYIHLALCIIERYKNGFAEHVTEVTLDEDKT